MLMLATALKVLSRSRSADRNQILPAQPIFKEQPLLFARNIIQKDDNAENHVKLDDRLRRRPRRVQLASRNHESREVL